MNSRGQVGLDTTKSVMMTIFVIGVIVFALIIAFTTLNDSDVAVSSGSGSSSNESLTTVNENGENLDAFTRADSSCTISEVRNETDGVVISSGNFTTSNNDCTIAFASGGDTNFNNTNWRVDYTFTFNQFDSTSGNITNATTDFFGNTGTWLALLAVVVIILIIAIVIIAVNRFGSTQSL